MTTQTRVVIVMAVIRTGRFGVVVAVLLMPALVALPQAGAAGASTVTGPTPIPSGPPGRSSIPHLSARLAALAVRPTAGRAAQARITGTALGGADSLARRPGTDQLLVDIRVAHEDAGTVARLRAAGAVITHRAPALRTITAAVAPGALKRIARTAGVQYVGEIETPVASAECDTTISAGDEILHAIDERTTRKVDGTGVTVGILSDSFDTRPSPVTTAAQDVVSDNLPGTANTCGHPTPVGVVQDYSGGGQEDEGRGMAQIVHDLAPGAKIMFATAEGGPDAMAAAIRALANQGADIIVDDVAYIDEPVYQDGVIAKAINDVRATGVDYFSSAANDNVIADGHDIASYEAVDGYRPTPCPATLIAHEPKYTDCHSFDANGADPTDSISLTMNRALQIALHWAEPQFGVKTDYDLCVLLSDGTFAFCGNERNPGAGGSQKAFELVGLTSFSTSIQIVVARYGGNDPDENGTPPFKIVFQTNGSGAVTNAEYAVPTGTDVVGPTTRAHNATSGAMTVAAQDVRAPGTLNYYSSRGPVRLLYGPVVGTTPAAALAHPKVLAKPDITASDCGVTTFFGFLDGSDWRFCGTSAAAPHAAAVAALLLQQNPKLTPGQLNTALTATATDLGAPAAAQGAGLVDAAAAGAAVVPARVTTTSLPSGVVGKPYAAGLHAKPNSPVTWAVTSGKLPPGLKLAKSGAISGRPTKSGTFHVTVAVTKSSVPKLSATKSLTIKIAPIAVRSTSLPDGKVGAKYSTTLRAYGGRTPLAWKTISGALPAGLTLAKSGAISGRPKNAGKFHLTVRVTDSAGHRASRALTILVTKH